MSNKKNKRWRLIADFKVQGVLCLRIAAYWIMCQLVFTMTVLGFAQLHGSSNPVGSSPWQLLVPALFVTSLVLPVMLLNAVMFSNRFAGPMYRVGKHLDLLAKGQDPGDITPRQGDHYQDIAANLNLIRQKLLSPAPPEADKTSDPLPAASHAEPCTVKA